MASFRKAAAIAAFAAWIVALLPALAQAGADRRSGPGVDSGAGTSGPERGAVVLASRDVETVKDIQAALNARGYDAGPVNGVENERLRRAIRAFQDDRNFRPTGELNDRQIRMLLRGQKRRDFDQPAEAEAQQNRANQTGRASSPPAQRPDLPIGGEWTGALTCPRGGRQEITLWLGGAGEGAGGRYTANKDGAPFAARLVQFVAGANVGYGARSDYVGEAASGGSYRFARVQSDSGVGDAVVRNFTIQPSSEAGRLKATIDGGDCTAFELQRPDAAALPQSSVVTPPAKGGTFYATSDKRGRCDALIGWTSSVETDFPLAQLKYGKFNRAIPFLDPAFVPVFGRPFDTPGQTELLKNVSDAISACRQMPLVRDGMEYAQSIMHFIDDKAALYIIHEVRKNRRAYVDLARARAEADRLQASDPKEALIRRSAARQAFLSARMLIPARTQNRVEAELEEENSKAAIPIVLAEETRWSGTSPEARLKSLKDARSFSTLPFSVLSKSARQEAEMRWAAIEDAAAREHFDPRLERARSAQRSPEGLREIALLIDQPTLGLLSTEKRKAIESAWNAVRADVMREAVEQDWRKATDLPQGLSGLAQGAEWLSGFRERWKPQLDAEPFRTMVKAFFQDRARRLRLAKAEFAGGLSASEADNRARLGRLLTLPEDRSDPVFLDYELAAAGL